MGLCLSVGGRRKRRKGRSEGHDDALGSEVVKEVLPTTQTPKPSFASTASASLAPPSHDVDHSKLFQQQHATVKLSISDAPAAETCSATQSIPLSTPTLTEDRSREIEEETSKLSRMAKQPRKSSPSPNPPPKIKRSLPGETTRKVGSASGVRTTPSPYLVAGSGAGRSSSRNKQQQQANVGVRGGSRSKPSTRACETADGATARVGSGGREMTVPPYPPPPKLPASSSTFVPQAREETSTRGKQGRQGEEEKGGDLGGEETMDDTLVSLECFIFL